MLCVCLSGCGFVRVWRGKVSGEVDCVSAHVCVGVFGVKNRQRMINHSSCDLSTIFCTSALTLAPTPSTNTLRFVNGNLMTGPEHT